VTGSTLRTEIVDLFSSLIYLFCNMCVKPKVFLNLCGADPTTFNFKSERIECSPADSDCNPGLGIQDEVWLI
jgi:hypothetical protein